jgi:hypothetical protein
MKIIFKTRYIGGESIIVPGCERSRALFDLTRRNTLMPSELRMVHKMGFDIEFCGEVKELSSSLKTEKIEHVRVPGLLTIVNDSE